MDPDDHNRAGITNLLLHQPTNPQLSQAWLDAGWLRTTMILSFFEQVYGVVRLIPPGRVATYGQIAQLLGVPRGARTVGWALRGLPEGSDVPWQRVISARGTISLAPGRAGAAIQRALLEDEGVAFGANGCVDLRVHGWSGLSPAERHRLLESDN